MVRRLAVLYAISALVMLLPAGVILYWSLQRSLQSEDEETLRNRIQLLSAVMQESFDSADPDDANKDPNDPKSIEEEAHWLVMSPEKEDYFRILSLDNRILLETPQMSEYLPISRFPAAAGRHNDHTPYRQIQAKHGRVYMLGSAWCSMEGASQPMWLLQVAVDVSHEDTLLAEYGVTLAIVIIAGVLFSGWMGMVVARKGLAPLAEITKVAQRITATQLHERIGNAPWPQELNALATAFDQMLNRLQDSFDRLSQFSADISHELRTPINNLMGETEVALSQARSPEEYRHVLESNTEEYQRLSRMISGLLFLARAENSAIAITRTEVDAAAEMEAVRAFYEAMAEEKGVEIRCEGGIHLHADQSLFRQALNNLVSNAIKHTSSGGNIVLSTRLSADGGAEVNVSDTGIGIDSEHLEKIFDRFYRVDRARSHSSQGTGLGLAIVKSIIELHGGTISATSELGKGTTITLLFPPQI